MAALMTDRSVIMQNQIVELELTEESWRTATIEEVRETTLRGIYRAIHDVSANKLKQEQACIARWLHRHSALRRDADRALRIV
jgi:hypothetical protein